MQKYISEFIGTFILLVSIVGSGIAGQQYTNDQMVILVSHAVVIGLTLIFIIGIFANFSGAHFNPIVSILFFLQKELSKKDLCLFISIQITAAILGTIFANLSGYCMLSGDACDCRRQTLRFDLHHHSVRVC